MLANTIAVYGEQAGLAALERWIARGDSQHVRRRTKELHAYHACNVAKGWKTLNGSLCQPEDLAFYTAGMFDDVLSALDQVPHVPPQHRLQLKQNVDKALFILLVCVWVAKEHNRITSSTSEPLQPYISTRQLAWLMGLADIEEAGRKAAGTARAYLMVGGSKTKAHSLGIFTVTEDSTHRNSPRFTLHPDFEYLLARVQTAFGHKQVGANELDNEAAHEPTSESA